MFLGHYAVGLAAKKAAPKVSLGTFFLASQFIDLLWPLFLLLGGVVLSHWILDFITHRPDLPLAPGTDVNMGLGLWNSVAGTLIFEAGLFITGIIIYLKTTKAKDRIGSYGFLALIGFLSIIYIGNVFGPPPPGESAIAVVGNASWLFVIWAYWVDRHRESGLLQHNR
jgi:hypothetical protein